MTFQENCNKLTEMVAVRCKRILDQGGRNKSFSWKAPDSMILSVLRRGDRWDVFVGKEPNTLVSASVETKMKAYVLLDAFAVAYAESLMEQEATLAQFIKEHS